MDANDFYKILDERNALEERFAKLERDYKRANYIVQAIIESFAKGTLIGYIVDEAAYKLLLEQYEAKETENGQ